MANGVSQFPANTFRTLDPATNESQATVAAAGAADIDAAAQAAVAAFPAWRTVAADEIVEKSSTRLLTELSRGRMKSPLWRAPIPASRSATWRRRLCVALKTFAFLRTKRSAANDGLALPDIDHLNYTVRQPIGPVGIITPWNTPFMLSTWKIAPALAAGCTIVHKPAEWSPLSAVLLAEIMNEVITEAGLPAGVVNLVHGLGESAGKALTEQRDIKAVAFVGESHTGSLIMGQGAPSLKRLHFELGGKNPVVVFADADLDRALDATLFMIYSLNGERCTSASRALVQRPIYEDFTARLAERVQAHSRWPATRPGNRDWPPDSSRSRREGAVLSGKSTRRGRKGRSRRRTRDGRRRELCASRPSTTARRVRWKLPRRRSSVPI